MSRPQKGNTMKFVRTTRGYQSLTVPKGDDETVTIDRGGVELSEENTKAAEKLAEKAGVALEVLDEEPTDEPVHVALGQQTPDLSAGRGAVTGTGDPVQTLDVEPDGDGEAGMDPDAAPTTTTTTAPARAAAKTTTAAPSGQGE